MPAAAEEKTEQKEIAKGFFDILPPVVGLEIEPLKSKDEEKIKEEERLKEEEKLKGGKPNEDEPQFVREPRKKATPDESIATLRKQRDEERERNKIFTETFGEHKPQLIKPILDLVSEYADGPLTEDSVAAVITKLKDAENNINSLQEELQKREQIISQLDVEHSSEFNSKYKEPYKLAHDTLFLEYASVASDKSIIAPKATDALHKLLTSNPEISGIEVKQALSQFAKAFKEESGEDAQLPSMNSLMNSLRAFKSSREAMQDAYTNWKTKKEEDAKSAQANQQIQTEAQKRASKKMRVDLISKAYREFDLDVIPFVDDKEAEELFKEEYDFGEKIFEGKEVPTYDAVMQKGVKARLWDKYASKLKDLIELEESIQKGERNGLPGSKNQVIKNKVDTKDWLGGALQ